MKRNMGVRFAGLVKPSNIHRRNFYICYHPDDKGTYSVLSAEIARIGGSALFRGTVGSLDAPFSETLELSAASLLVMIVSNSSLSESNTHLAPALKIAREMNIPVLPILVDDCSAQDINGLFDGRHCFSLNKQHKLDQALSNRLEKYLLSLYACDDKTISRINEAAFRKRIFVSYRRRDKEQVQAFLRKLQADDRLVDVALWWDACLTPNEVFTEELSQSISASDVFLLCVTNNTFEKGNYILTSELPLALKQNIPIVPVELGTSNYYEDSDLSGIIGRLYTEVDAVDRIEEIIPPVEGLSIFSPEKCYLLSRAYWLGIGTEINYSLAVLLNDLAAERKYKKAIDLQVIMEEYGHGERRNIENALTWKQKKVMYLRNRARRTKETRDVVALCVALFELVDIQLTSPNVDEKNGRWKDPGTTRIEDLAWSSDRTIATGVSYAVDGLREIINTCKPLCEPYLENSDCTCALAHAYSKLSWLLYQSYRCILWAGDGEFKDDLSALFMNEALDYALSLETLLKDIESTENTRLQEVFYHDFLSWQKRLGMLINSGFSAVQRMRGENYELICRLAETVDMPCTERRAWNKRACEYAWSCMLQNRAGIDNVFWINRLRDACDRVTNMLEYEGRNDEAENVYRMFYAGEISKHILGTHEWHHELRDDLCDYGFRRLMELYMNTENYEKARMMFEHKMKR